MANDNESSYDGPEIEVWNYLWSAVDMAADELRGIRPDTREFLERVAKAIVSARSEAIVAPESFGAKLLTVDDEILKYPWIRHVTEIEIATIGIGRAESALRRYLRIRPIVLVGQLPERARAYMGEVISTYAFGFDAACIALCRATLEQVLRDALVDRNVYTAPQLKRERPTAGSLVANAKRAGVLVASAAAADRIVNKGDTVMHHFLYDDKVIEQQAFDSLNDLLEVLAEVLRA